ncbi:hypothetical protein [Cupriavidus oxalaticus]|jgi:hypothetical protein|uniref:Uncharacterized protein n=1 Tax=Cupriavidus oxalaticus TaxID=96344 RepID=A0A375G466_9BURK|nr:hypothetical protein [Cupriavidus oxalaticus]QRQ88356.1 hypothetical protein JTE91_17385 [Cupriavidus oxalaticus]QRQ93317.1 hypothetical protein JTE92_24875 [Cupriavidus oxalaticus]WQD81934.1 hypothetical protein U0036_12620 [Cupriavidus oxalaticus]SPC13512.1 conserved hypothetical protein [Cupriavidus oxalaticus]
MLIVLTIVEPLNRLGLSIVRTPFWGHRDICVTDDFGNLIECESLGQALAFAADIQSH